MKTKKIKHLLIGSNNPGKVREIKQLLPRYINVSSIIDYKIRSPKETGKTFLQNSFIKSKYFSKKDWPNLFGRRLGFGNRCFK